MSYEHHIGDIKKGDRFCEFDGSSVAVRFIALEDGHLVKRDNLEYWTIEAQYVNSTDKCIFSIDVKYLHYGPELYAGNEVPYLDADYMN